MRHARPLAQGGSQWHLRCPGACHGGVLHRFVSLVQAHDRGGLEDLFGVPMSVGTISQSEKLTTEVLAKPVEQARDAVEAQAVAHLDETSWRQSGKRAWLWVAVTSVVTVFLVRLSRGGQVARELLGEHFRVFW